MGTRKIPRIPARNRSKQRADRAPRLASAFRAHAEESSPVGRGENGAVLILALIFLLVVSLVITAILTWAGTSLTATGSFQTERNTEYGATAAVNLAVQTTRRPSTRVRPPLSSTTRRQNSAPRTGRRASTSTAPWSGSPTARTPGCSPIPPASLVPVPMRVQPPVLRRRCCRHGTPSMTTLGGCHHFGTPQRVSRSLKVGPVART